MPAAKHVDEPRVRSLHDAAVRAGLTAHRDALLLGIDRGFTSGLPVSDNPSAQLLSDLFHLADVSLSDDSIPLIAWLRNALGLVGAQDLASVFEDTLQHLGQPVPGRSRSGNRAPLHVPFFQNTGFVGRDTDLGELHALLQKGGAVGVRPAALTGMGGGQRWPVA